MSQLLKHYKSRLVNKKTSNKFEVFTAINNNSYELKITL